MLRGRKTLKGLEHCYAGSFFPVAPDNLAGNIMLYPGVYVVGIEEDVGVDKDLIAHATHPVSDSRDRRRVSILFPCDPTPVSWHS